MCTKYWLTLRQSKHAQESVVRLTDRPDMALDVYRGRKTTTQQQHIPESKFFGTRKFTLRYQYM